MLGLVLGLGGWGLRNQGLQQACEILVLHETLQPWHQARLTCSTCDPLMWQANLRALLASRQGMPGSPNLCRH